MKKIAVLIVAIVLKDCLKTRNGRKVRAAAGTLRQSTAADVEICVENCVQVRFR